MGCGNCKADFNENQKENKLSVYNPDKIVSRRKSRDLIGNSTLNQETSDQIKLEVNNFKKLSEDARNLSVVKWEKLLLDDQTYHDLLRALNENVKLSSFCMDNVQIEGDSDKFIPLAKVLMKKSKLKSLELNSLANLGNKKAKSIAKIMESCKRMGRLAMKELELDEEDGQFIGLILSELAPKLEYFELSLVFFQTAQQDFLRGLYNNNVIKELVLNKINLIEKDFIFLVEAISTNYCLVRLDVSNNPIKSGTKAFREFNLYNLTKLQMNNCAIDDEAFMYLSEGIKENKSLKLLELNMNQITEFSALSFQLLFESNTSIQNIYLLNNPICKRDLNTKLDNNDLLKVVSEM